MEKKNYNMVFRSNSGFLESRQTSKYSAWQADSEAKLYAEWATVHYGCEVFYSITEQ